MVISNEISSDSVRVAGLSLNKMSLVQRELPINSNEKVLKLNKGRT